MSTSTGSTPEKLATVKIASASVNKCWDQIDAAMRTTFSVVVERNTSSNIERKNVIKQMEWYSLVFQACNPQGGGAGSSGAGQGGHSHHSAQIIFDRAIELVSSLGPALARSLTTSSGPELLRELAHTYSNYRVFVKFMSNVLSFLPKVFTSAQSLEKTLLELYKQRVFKTVMSSNLKDAFLFEIEKVRRGERVDFEMARGVVSQCAEFGVYVEELETPLLEESKAFFRDRSQVQPPQLFMEFAEATLGRELILVTKILASGTRVKLLKLFDTICVEPHHMKVLTHEECGLRRLMEDNKWAEVSRMFHILSRLDAGLDRMADVFTAVIVTHGMALNQLLLSGDEETKYKTYITECTNLHEKYVGILSTHLENNATFSKAVKKAFENFFNDKVKTTTTNAKTGESEGVAIYQCEQLVLYMDAMLRHDPNVSITCADEEAVLMEKCTALFVCVHEKDMFQEMYKHKMAKRLLAASSSDDSERSFLSRLQREMGQSYTYHMEQMLKDLGVGRDLQNAFAATEGYTAMSTEISTQVLTSAHWPPFKIEKLIVPTSLRSCLNQFEAFYKKASTAHEVRKLNWVYALGSSLVSANFVRGQKELVLTTYQALILLHVEANPNTSVQAIASALGMEITKLKPHLASLCMQKAYAVLSKSQDPSGAKPGIADTDTLIYNDDFTYKLRKFKVPPPTDTSDRRTVIDKTNGNRQFIVEACIVRVMKSRREMKFQPLVAEVTDQLTRLFTQDVKFIKARIGELVVRGYLERDEADLNTFRYLTH